MIKTVWTFFFIFTSVFSLNLSASGKDEIRLDFEDGDFTSILIKPITKEDWESYARLQGSKSACMLFRDGKPRSREECEPQFNMTCGRSAVCDPRAVRTVWLEKEGKYLFVGTVVAGGSTVPGWSECAIILHPGVTIPSGDPVDFSEDKIDSLKEAFLGNRFQSFFAETFPSSQETSYVPTWGKNILNAITAAFFSPESIKSFADGFKISTKLDFKGFVATSSNPATLRVLRKYGFLCTPPKDQEIKWQCRKPYEQSHN